MPHLLVLLLSCEDNEKAKPTEKMAAALRGGFIRWRLACLLKL